MSILPPRGTALDASAKVRLLRRRFFNRTDRIAFLAPWKKPCPIEGGDLDALLAGHVLGDKAPPVRVRWTTKEGKSGEEVGRFRLGTYSPAPDGRTVFGCVDCDGGGRHGNPLVDPLGAALRIIDALAKSGVVAHLECSGSGTGWHLWVFFDAPVPAAKIRRLLLALMPADAALKSGEFADAKRNRGLEIFPKQDALADGEIGNMVWLPQWWAAEGAGNRFHRVSADGEVEPCEPDDLQAVSEADLDQALQSIDAATAEAATSRQRPTLNNQADKGGDAAGNERDRLLKRARAYIATAEPAVSGEHGHDKTFYVACKLVQFGLTRTEADQLLKEYSDRCRPPWSDGERKHKLDGAFDATGPDPKYTADRPAQVERNGHAHNGAANGGSDQSAPGPPAAARELEAKLPQGGPDEHLTDLGNARRVVARHGQDLRYCHPWKAWSIWDGRRWAEDVTAEAVRRVKDTQGELYRFAASRIDGLGDAGDDDGRKARLTELMALVKHALKWEDAKRISACLDLARSEPHVPVLTEDLDRGPMLLNVRNGTLDLHTGGLRPHRREDLLTKLAPVEYDPSAQCPLWMRFLARILDGNDPLMRYLQRVVGYCLTGDVSEQAMWFLHGSGSNGKSTFLGVLLHLFGDYGMQSVSELLMAKDHEAHPAERAALFGKRLVATVETEEGKRMAEALMKQLTGGDRITARRMYKDFFEFTPTHKILLAANHKPTIRGTDRAVWRRIKLVPFTVTITEAEKDKGLLDKLKAEGPGILAWAVRGCMDWLRQGMGEPAEVQQATAEYQAEQDTLGEFLDACCVVHPEASTMAATLLSAYAAWSGDKFMNPKKFGQRMKERGFESRRQGRGCFYHGLGVRESDGVG